MQPRRINGGWALLVALGAEVDAADSKASRRSTWRKILPAQRSRRVAARAGRTKAKTGRIAIGTPNAVAAAKAADGGACCERGSRRARAQPAVEVPDGKAAVGPPSGPPPRPFRPLRCPPPKRPRQPPLHRRVTPLPLSHSQQRLFRPLLSSPAPAAESTATLPAQSAVSAATRRRHARRGGRGCMRCSLFVRTRRRASRYRQRLGRPRRRAGAADNSRPPAPLHYLPRASAPSEPQHRPTRRCRRRQPRCLGYARSRVDQVRRRWAESK